MSFIDFIGRQLNPNNYCAKCKVKLGEKNGKIKCEWCEKYYCSNHILTWKHSRECQEKYLNYKEWEKRKKAEAKVILKKEMVQEKANIKRNPKDKYWETHCAKCRKEFTDWTNSHKCSYCGRYFCSSHWVPETHNCPGNPERPPGGFREIHSAGGKIIASGK